MSASESPWAEPGEAGLREEVIEPGAAVEQSGQGKVEVPVLPKRYGLLSESYGLMLERLAVEAARWRELMEERMEEIAADDPRQGRDGG